jgi:hypothetical protein
MIMRISPAYFLATLAGESCIKQIAGWDILHGRAPWRRAKSRTGTRLVMHENGQQNNDWQRDAEQPKH